MEFQLTLKKTNYFLDLALSTAFALFFALFDVLLIPISKFV